MKSISFNCTKIEHPRRGCGANSARDGESVLAHMDPPALRRMFSRFSGVACWSSSCRLWSEYRFPSLPCACFLSVSRRKMLLHGFFFLLLSCSHSPHFRPPFFSSRVIKSCHSCFPSPGPSCSPSAAALLSAGWPLLGNLCYPPRLNELNK